jgi:hypothetical protein
VAASSSLGAVAVPSGGPRQGATTLWWCWWRQPSDGGRGAWSVFSENCFAESYRCSQHTCAMNPGGGSR